MKLYVTLMGIVFVISVTSFVCASESDSDEGVPSASIQRVRNQAAMQAVVTSYHRNSGGDNKYMIINQQFNNTTTRGNPSVTPSEQLWDCMFNYCCCLVSCVPK